MRLLHPYSYVKKLLKKIAANVTEITDLPIPEILTATETDTVFRSSLLLRQTKMKYNFIIKRSFSFCLTIIILFLSYQNSFAANRINPSADLKYIGAFRVPYDSSSNYAWAWITKHGLTFNPSGDAGKGSLISSPVVNQNSKYFPMVTELTIPTPVISPSKTITDLPIAKTLNDWKDLTEGKYDQGQNQKRLSGLIIVPKRGTQSSDKIYWITSDWYNPPFNFPSLGMSNLDFSSPKAKGPWIINGSWAPAPIPSAKTSKYLLNIPQNWADKYAKGYAIGTGENKPNNNGSRGACLYAVKPWSMDDPPWSAFPKGSEGSVPADAQIDSIELLCPGMDKSQRRNFDGSLWDEFSYSDGQYDAVWVDNTTNEALIFSGDIAYLPAKDTGVCDLTQGELCEYYKKDSPPGDPDMPPCSYPPACPASPDACDSGDYRGEPYWRVLWFYDVNDLAAVAQGIKSPWEPQPYSVFNLESFLFYEARCTKKHIGGITYDTSNKRIFIVELVVDATVSKNDPMPIIHVFKISDSVLGEDNEPPSAATNITIKETPAGNQLAWEHSSDNLGPIMYIVHRNGKPIGISNYPSFLDENSQYFSLPHMYKIEVRDSVNNSTIGLKSPHSFTVDFNSNL